MLHSPCELPEPDPKYDRSGLMFLDSGAHSLYTKYGRQKAAIFTGGESVNAESIAAMTGAELSAMRRLSPNMFRVKDAYAFYRSDEFWDYVDTYARFVKRNLAYIDYYVTVDVIFNAKLSWRVLKYLENEHGLKPVPVIHFGTELKWIHKHLEAGYEFLGIGGLGQEAKKGSYLIWADKVFDILCPLPSRLPIVRTHGFAMTAHSLLTRYPWWSVDSASWVRGSAYGFIYVPRKRKGKYDYNVPPFTICVSTGSPLMTKGGSRHLNTISAGERRIIKEWIRHINMPLGSVDEQNEMVAWGVISNHKARARANLKYFCELMRSMPTWPWPFKGRSRKGLFDG